MRLFLPFILFVWIGPALGASELIAREVTGFGKTEELAITDALVRGIQQIRGIELSAANSMRSEISKLIEQENGVSSKSLTATKELQKKVQTQTKGYVKTYEILSLVFDEERERWRAALRVEIPRYKATGQDRSGLKTIAVLPFRDLTGSSNQVNAVVQSLDNGSAVKMTLSGGVYQIPVAINDVLKIQMIIDSGASDVFITPDVAMALWRTGTISEDDALADAYYQFADGSVQENARFRLKSVTIGDRRVENVVCSVSNSIDAPMLLGQSALAKLGRYSFDYKQGMLVIGQDVRPSLKGSSTVSDVSRQLNQKLISELTQARKFRVLDREYMSEFLGEQELLRSGGVPMEESLRLGQRLGADFLVVGTISQFRINEKEVEVLGINKTLREATINFDFRVIELATEEVRWSNTFNKRLDHRLLGALMPQGVTEDVFQIREAVLTHAGHATATELLDVIFPIKVVSVEAGEIYLNQGGIRVKQGEVFDVFTAGRNVIDPDTGLKIRLDGPHIATIKITKVMPKFSLAELVAGEDGQEAEQCELCELLGATCRRSRSSSASGDQAPAEPGATATW